MSNNYNTKFKGQLILEKNRHFFIFDSDKVEVPVTINPKFYHWLTTNNIDITCPRVYEGQLRTARYPYLSIDELRNVDLSGTEVEPNTFNVEGRVFRVYKNFKDKYDQEYNFLLVSVGKEPNRYLLKMCFCILDNTQLIDRYISFNLKRVRTNLVIQSYSFLDFEEDLTYGELHG